ncbi:hypothetical protein CKF94_01520 [Vibrio coralliilyticus]|nr:hypothetical protein DVV14_24295 [Vibrio coralliilyticus]PAU39762.1 hypothetical protein CKF94_01520 [Vibrio coralliilyticus]
MNVRRWTDFLALRIDGERIFIKLVVAMLLIDVFYLMHIDCVRGINTKRILKGKQGCQWSLSALWRSD